MKPTTDALEILNQITAGDPEILRGIEEERANLDVAHKLIDLRTSLGLSQTQLAKKVGTTQSVISRLEDADYEGHSLSMLKRIAAALDRRVDIRFLPAKKSRALAHA